MQTLVKNFYLILGVDPGVTMEAIEAAYRQLAFQYHPDLNPSPDATLRMQEINEAYTILRSPERRARYDREHAIHFAIRDKRRVNVDMFTWRGSSRRPAQRWRPEPEPAPQPAAKRPAQKHEHVLVFSLGRQTFGLDLADVEFVERIQPILPLGGAPDFIEGMITFRGARLPLINLRLLLGLAEIPATHDTRIIISNIQGTRLGIVVDGVENFVELPASALEPAPPIPYRDGLQFVKCIAKIDFQLVVLLNLGGLLTAGEKDCLAWLARKIT